MNIKTIPVRLHPNEIRQNEGAHESVWTPGDTVCSFKEWTRYSIQRNAELQKNDNHTSLPVNIQSTIQDTQSKWKLFFREKPPVDVHGEMFAPVGIEGESVEVQKTTNSSIRGVLIWSTTDGYVLDKQSVSDLFPDAENIEQQGDAWVVHQRTKSADEKLQDRLELKSDRAKETALQHATRTTDLMSEEKIVTLPFSGTTQENGDFVYSTLEAAAKSTEAGGTVNIHAAVHACDSKGPLLGFKHLFSAEEQAQFAQADHALADKVAKEFFRHCLANEVGELARRADRGIEMHLEPAVDNIVNADARASVQRFINTWKANASNPNRNFYMRSRRYATPDNPEPQEGFPVAFYREDPQFFSVGKMDSANAGDNVGAGYEPTKSIVIFKQTNAELTFFDAMDVMHEVTHKNQHQDLLDAHSDDVEAAQERIIAPIKATKSNANGVLEEECEAWSNMIEIFHARIGYGKFSPQDVMEQLGMDPDDEHRLQCAYQLLQLSVSYNAGGGRKGDVYPPAFVEAIKELYLRVGVELYTRGEDGFPVPYKEE